ncbi:hypothetical protein PF007_g32589 [Phytophthora fragariae]|uniref:Uncharacterized protein n=1 Tax=Phytophthora fragariae TaxID=53985 RepID=A0A6A3PGY9_9STRA|nr:hypothetical protein PF007_g32589 [Phytophthora fragariae]KAE9055161.1 hypothetical protein PF006_g33049 [Phytophthora fragariae]
MQRFQLTLTRGLTFALSLGCAAIVLRHAGANTLTSI